MKLPRLGMDNFQFTVIVIALFVLIGLGSFLSMPRSEDPQVASPAVSVVAVYPGANPEVLERLVVDPLEEALSELDNVKKIVSNAEDEVVSIVVEFEYGEDPEERYADVVQQVNSIRDELPPEVVNVEMRKWTISDYVNVFQLALVADSADYLSLDREAIYLKKKLEKVRGLKKVHIEAIPDRRVDIVLDLEKMAAHRISMNEIAAAIRSHNLNIPGGQLHLGSRRYNLLTGGAYTSLEEIRQTVIRSAGHHVLFLKDIATIEMCYEKPKYLARYNGRPAAFVVGTQKERTNLLEIMRDVRRVVAAEAKQLPPRMRLQWVFDQSESVKRRVNGFFANLLQGVVLVGCVMGFILGFRPALIVMIMVPLSILIGIGFLDLSGFGIEQMSITGLVIALGLLVDNAIVVTENVTRFLRQGYEFREAAVRGTAQIGWAVVSSTATTVLAFIPIVFMQDVSGDFIRSMPLTVVYTLIASLFISLTLIPFLSSRFCRTCIRQAVPRGQHWVSGFVDRFYRSALRFSLTNPKTVLLAAGLAFMASLGLFPLVGVSFFPKAEKPQFLIDIDLPRGTALEKTDAITRDIEQVLAAMPQVRGFAANVGKGNPVVYYNSRSRKQASHGAQIFVQLHPEAQPKMQEVLQSLRTYCAALPGVKVQVKEFTQGPPVEAPIAIRVIGERIDRLTQIAREVEHLIAGSPGTLNVNNPVATAKSELQLRINREKAGLLGVSLAEIDRTVRAAVSGVSVSRYRDEEGEEHDIVLRLPMTGAPKISDLSRISVSSRRGAAVPLRQVAVIEPQTAPPLVSHYNFDRSFTITADVVAGASVDRITRQIVAQLAQYDWPKGYAFAVAGEVESRQTSFSGMAQAILVALAGIFAVLVLQFRSFAQPLIVFTAIPLAVIGSLLALLLTGNTFSFTAFVGLTSLVGIVVNNSIILVDYTNQLRRAGYGARQALEEAGITRFLPIVLTTVTTVFGLLPLTLQGGTLWAPMGWTIIGGLLVSTLLTLLVVPVLYTYYTPEQAFAALSKPERSLLPGGTTPPTAGAAG